MCAVAVGMCIAATDGLAGFHLMCRWGWGVSLGAISGLAIGASLRLRSGAGATGKHTASCFNGFQQLLCVRAVCQLVVWRVSSCDVLSAVLHALQ